MLVHGRSCGGREGSFMHRVVTAGIDAGRGRERQVRQRCYSGLPDGPICGGLRLGATPNNGGGT